MGIHPQNPSRVKSDYLGKVREIVLISATILTSLARSSLAMGILSDSIGTMLSSTHSHRFFDGQDKDLSVTNLTRLSGLTDSFDAIRYLVIRDRDIDEHFRQEVDRTFASTRDLDMIFFVTEAFNLSNRHAVNSNFRESFLHSLKFKWLNDRFY